MAKEHPYKSGRLRPEKAWLNIKGTVRGYCEMCGRPKKAHFEKKEGEHGKA